MNTHTLAASGIEALIPIIAVAVWVISSIVKALSQQKQRNDQRDPRKSLPTAPASGEAKSVEERLREIAEYRRRQLSEGATATPPPVPRTAQSAQQAAERQQPGSSTRHETTAHRAAEEARSREIRKREALRQAETRRQAHKRQNLREAEEVRRAARQREVQRQQFLETDRARLAAESHAQPRSVAEHAEAVTASMAVRTTQPGLDEQVHRHVADAGTTSVSTAHPRHLAMKLVSLNPTAMRQVIVLKEVLEKPLALRDPLSLPYEL